MARKRLLLGSVALVLALVHLGVSALGTAEPVDGSGNGGHGWFLLAVFAGVVLFFHASEIAITWLYNKDELSFDTLLLSRPYLFAMSLCIVEFVVEWWFFPWLKSPSMWFISLIGFAITLTGEIIRKSAMITAKRAFTHRIQHDLRSGHKLINWGLYRYIRHPGYFGWMLWAPGHQILLVNPICSVLFFCVAVYFFYDRIPYEEDRLVELFGAQYKQYRARTPTYIPFCK